MLKSGSRALLAVATVSAALLAAPVVAATYKFTPLGSSPSGLDVEARIGFADGAGPVSGNKLGAGFAGITDFLFRVGGFEVDLAALIAMQADCASDPAAFPCSNSVLDYALAPKAGSIYYNDTGSDFLFEYDGLFAAGYFNSDGVGPEACQTTGECNFRGLWTTVAEPASLAALLLAFGIGAGLRRRR